MKDNDNKPLPYVRTHMTHYACDERIAKYGANTVGCCCCGHNCGGMPPIPELADRMIKGNERNLRKRRYGK